MANKKKESEQLSEQQVWDVLNFTSRYYNSTIKSIYQQYFTPDLVNSKLKDITDSPLAGTIENVESYLKDAKHHEQELIGLQEYFELVDMLTKRTLNYMGKLPSFDYTVNCINIKDSSEYKSKEYKSDLDKVKNFLNKFDVKQEFSNILNTLMRQETAYYMFRQDGLRYQFQELPRNYCKITGKWDYGFLYDFNMVWFLEPGADINMYPDAMKKRFYKTFMNPTNKYNPDNSLGKRKDSFAFWAQTDPEDGFWAFKFSPYTNLNIPYLSGTFPDVVLRPLIRTLQTDNYAISASKLILGTIPMIKDAKSGAKVDNFSISPESLGNFLGLIKAALNNPRIKIGGVPFEDTKVLDFKPNDNSMMNEYNKNTASTMGVTNRSIFSDERLSAAEVEMSKDIDSFIVTYVYPYFAHFLNYQINKITKKYNFKFIFEGTNYTSNRKERLDTALKLAQVGIVLPQKIAAAIGMDIFTMEAQMDEAKSNGFTDKLLSLLNLNTSKNGGETTGRPNVDPDEAGDSTGNKLE